MTDGFAPPLKKLGESGIGVAAAPSGGMGFALNPDGTIPDNLVNNNAILDSAITSAKILDGTIAVADIATGTFLELAVAGGRRRVSFDTGFAAYGGASTRSNNFTATFPITYPSAPFMYVTVGPSSGLTSHPSVAVTAVTTTTATIVVQTVDAQVPLATATTQVFWLAID
jgi:hypothetical protein